MWDKLRAQLVRRGPSMLRLPIKLTPFAVQRQVLEQVLHWQLRTSWPGTEAALQLFQLADSALDGVSGEISWPAPFAGIEP